MMGVPASRSVHLPAPRDQRRRPRQAADGSAARDLRGARLHRRLDVRAERQRHRSRSTLRRRQARGTALEDAIEAAAGFRPPVVVRTPGRPGEGAGGQPVPRHRAEVHARRLHVAKPDRRRRIADLGDIDCSPEGFTIAGKEIYLNYVNGAGQSKKLARIPFEKKLGVSITARNLNTVSALISLASP